MSFSRSRLYFPADVDVVEIESSNDTESDLPGPGRTLGKLYRLIGRHIERGVSAIAEKRGYGPLAVAERIRTRQSNNYGERYTFAIVSKQEKDCKRLIQYTRSKVETTRKQALESIIDFATDRFDVKIFDLLKALNAVQTIEREESFIWKYCDESLVLSSRMALACLQETKIASLAKYCAPMDDLREGELMDFMRMNPEESFLALRLFTFAAERTSFWLHRIENMVETMAELARFSPESIENEECNKVIDLWLTSITYGGERCLTNSRLLGCWHLIEERLPIVYKSKDWNTWLTDIECIKGYPTHSSLDWIARNAHFDRWPERRREASAFYQYLRPFLNPCDLALSRLAAQLAYRSSVSFCEDDIRRNCETLVGMLSCENDHLKLRAEGCVRLALRHDVYSRTAMVAAFTNININGDDNDNGFKRLLKEEIHVPESSIGLPFFIDRHVDKHGNFLHIPESSNCSEECAGVHQFIYRNGGVIMVRFSRGTTIQLPEIVSPLSAGRQRDDQPTYLAAAFSRTHEIAECCSITMSTKPEDYLVRDYFTKKFLVPESIGVFILRYPPEAYTNEYMKRARIAGDDGEVEEEEYERERLDVTGPYAWIPLCDLSYIKEVS